MGLEIGIGWLTFWMFSTLIFLLLLGLPLAFVTGGLGGHSAAGGSDFRPDYAIPTLGWGLWFAGSASRRSVPLVRSGLHGKHADVLFKPAFRIRSFLSQECGAA